MIQTIKKVDDNGSSVELTDGSNWEINSMHNIRTSLWMVGDRIAKVNSEDPIFPTMLVNVTKVECAQAKVRSA